MARLRPNSSASTMPTTCSLIKASGSSGRRLALATPVMMTSVGRGAALGALTISNRMVSSITSGVTIESKRDTRTIPMATTEVRSSARTHINKRVETLMSTNKAIKGSRDGKGEKVPLSTS